MPSFSYPGNRHGAQWREAIHAAIGRDDEAAHAFVDELHFLLCEYEAAKRDHDDKENANNITLNQFKEHGDRLTKAVDQVLDEILYLRGGYGSHRREGSDRFFHGLYMVRRDYRTEKTGLQFVGELTSDLETLKKVIEYGQIENSANRPDKKDSREKPFRPAFARAVAVLVGERLGVTPTSYVSRDHTRLGVYANVLKICLEAANDDQGLDGLVKHGAKYYKERI